VFASAAARAKVSDVKPASVEDPWADVVGQGPAVSLLRAAAQRPVHAYLFVGPPGSGKRVALRAFAADLLTASAPPDDPEPERHRWLAMAEQHPDLVIVEPEGTQFRGGKVAGTETEGARFLREAWRSPVECGRKVVAALGFETANPTAVGSLLKTIEEPPDTAVLVLLAESVPPEQVTIASRCVRVDFAAVSAEAVRDRLIAEGIAADVAEQVAGLAAGDLGRARLLASDERLALRVDAWASVPSRLDGSGATAANLAAELRSMIDDAQAPLDRRHEAEIEELNERIERYGQRGSGAKELEALHRRQRRGLRTDELRLGLATVARTYRDELAVSSRPAPLLEGLAAIQAAAEALIRNPNEELLLQALLVRLPVLVG
jgi:DNA polymerase-3 subunit delta'